jgi:DNA-binding transcriptional ArsR family regulator
MTQAERALDALGDPTRRLVFKRLRKGTRSVRELSDGMDVSRPAVSQHLKVLKAAGLIVVRTEGTRRLYGIDRQPDSPFDGRSLCGSLSVGYACPDLTHSRPSSILGRVLNFSRRLSAVVLVTALAAANAAVCAGWMPTPEARMACCSKGACPMHESDSDETSSRQVVSQAQADTRCASSERDDAAPSSSPFVLLVSLDAIRSPVQFVLPEAVAAFHASQTVVPLRGTHVPKHLLLSVFLV